MLKSRSPLIAVTLLVTTFALGGFASVGCVKIITPPEAEILAADAGTTLSPPTGSFLWLDADHAASFTLTGALVDQWADRSGTGNHATASIGGRPVLTAAAIGGRPAVAFDGVDDAVVVLDHASIRPATELSMCMVGMTASAINDTFYYKNSDGGWTDGYAFVGVEYNFANEFQFWVGNYTAPGGAVFYGSVAVTLNTPQIYCGSYDAVGNSVWIDGTLATAVQASRGAIVHGAGNLYIGGGSGALDGKIAELLIYPRALTDTEREDLEGYLAVKWGLRSRLPGAHRWR